MDDDSATSGYEVPVKGRIYGVSLTGSGPQAAASQETFAWNSRFQEILQDIARLDVDTDFTKVRMEHMAHADHNHNNLIFK